MHGIGGIALYGNVRCPGRGHEIAESHDIATPPLIAHKPMSGTMIPLVLKRRAAGSADLERSAPPAAHTWESLSGRSSARRIIFTYILTHLPDATLVTTLFLWSAHSIQSSLRHHTPPQTSHVSVSVTSTLHTTPQHVGAASAGLRRVCARTNVPSFRVYAFTCTSP